LHVEGNGDIIHVKTKNVHSFTIDSKWANIVDLIVDGVCVPIPKFTGLMRIQAHEATVWDVSFIILFW
jgi:hypothetical protein